MKLLFYEKGSKISGESLSIYQSDQAEPSFLIRNKIDPNRDLFKEFGFDSEKL